MLLYKCEEEVGGGKENKYVSEVEVKEVYWTEGCVMGKHSNCLRPVHRILRQPNC